MSELYTKDTVINDRTQIRVRYADTDQMGVVYYGIYLTWFEIGRTEIMRDTGLTYHEVEKYGVRIPVIEAGLKYLKPAYYDDVLHIQTFLEKRTGLRVRFEYIIWRNDEKLATGFTEHILTNDKLHPAKPPKELLDKLQKLWGK